MGRLRVGFSAVIVLFGLTSSPLSAADPASFATEPVQSACEDGSSCCPSVGCSCLHSPWEVKAGFVLLHRTGLPSRELARGLSAAPQPVLNANQYGFDFEGGPDLTILRHGDVADLEFRWFQVHDWIGTTPPLNDVGWGLNFRTLQGPTRDTDLSSRYVSQVSNFELNVKRPVNDWITGLAGFRFVEFNEHLGLFMDQHEVFSPHVHVMSFNDLYGFQLGTEIKVWDRGGPFRLGALGKAGIYGNSARNRALLYDDPAEDPGVDSASKSHLAFVGEIGLVGTYQISRRLAVRIGYQVMWLDGVALASQQEELLDPFEPTSPPGASVDTGETAFYHGVVGGFDLRW